MKPGRELDALVAEKVMSLKIIYRGGEFYYSNPPWNYKGPYNIDHERIIPQYSNVIECAYEIVEKINPDKFKLVRLQGLFGPYWFAHFVHETATDAALTPAHAICLAALKVVGIGINEIT